MRGRPEESGYNSQFLILGTLQDSGCAFQEIIDKTGLDRNTVARNLSVLVKQEIIEKHRCGRKSIYKIDMRWNGLQHLKRMLLCQRRQLEKIKRNWERLKRLSFRQLKAILTEAETNLDQAQRLVKFIEMEKKRIGIKGEPIGKPSISQHELRQVVSKSVQWYRYWTKVNPRLVKEAIETFEEERKSHPSKK